MKTLRYRVGNSEKPGVLDSDENIRNVSSLINDWDNTTVTIEKLESIKSVDLSTLPKAEKVDSLAPPIIRKDKLGPFDNSLFEYKL